MKTLTPETEFTVDSEADVTVETQEFLKNSGVVEKNTPPKLFRRNSYGLLVDEDYKFKEDGKVDYVAMLKPEHLVFNEQRKEEIERVYGKPIAELNVKEVDPKYLLVLLAGIRYLAQLRGVTDIYNQIDHVGDCEASATCSITFIPNYESENKQFHNSDSAGANRNNMSPIGKNKMGEWVYYPEAIATNRAFVRCVRSALNIPIAGKDEIATNTGVVDEPVAPSGGCKPLDSLINVLAKHKISFDKFRARLLEDGKVEAEDWGSLEEIPVENIFSLISWVNKRVAEKAEKKTKKS